MKVKARLLAFGLTALLGAVALTTSAAWGSEAEVPFWNIAGKRFEVGSRQASITNASGEKTTLHSKIGTTEVEIRCGSSSFGEAGLEGSQPKHAGKTSGSMTLSECKLFAKEGETFKEQTGCEVPTIKSGKLPGSLWLEGKKGNGTDAVIVFAPAEKLIATVTVNSKETCAFKGSYPLAGSFAAKLLPQNEEFAFVQLLLPGPAIGSAWRPRGEGETSIALTLEGNSATLQGEWKAELESKDRFGGGTNPVAGIEAPFWGVERTRLEFGKERALETGPIGEPAKLAWKLVGTEVETRCSNFNFTEGITLYGSLHGSDGRAQVKNLELSGCKLFAKEGAKFVEQSTCEVPPFTMNPLSGRLWLKGRQEERGTIPLLVFDPTKGVTLAKEIIKPKGGEKCVFEQAEYAIEGSLLFQLTPENQEAKVLGLTVSESSSAIYQPAPPQQKERQVVVSHKGEPIYVAVPEVQIKLRTQLKEEKSKQEKATFGGGPIGVGEGPGPFWRGRASGTQGEGARILEKAPETFGGEGGEQRLRGEFGLTSIEIVASKVQLSGQLYDSPLQGQMKLERSYGSPRLVKPALEGCTVTLGKANTVTSHGHLMWKWSGEKKQLEQLKNTTQKPNLVLTSAEIPEGAAELPASSLTVKLGSGCGVLTGTTFTMDGAETAMPKLANLEEWGKTFPLRVGEGEYLQHFWNGRENIGTETGLLLGSNAGSFTGQTEIKPEHKEIAIFEY